jgi:hypothetical protein
MKRREFLIGSAITLGSSKIRGQRPAQSKLDRVAIMSLCFSPILKSDAHPDDPKRTLDVMDLPDMIAERYGVHYVEMQHSHFLSTEFAYLEEFRSRMRKAKSQINQINLEFGPLNISSPDPVLRVETIDLNKRWIDHAVTLGCPRVMVNQGTLAPEVRQDAISTLRTINAYAKVKKVFVTMENRGGGVQSGRAAAAAAAASRDGVSTEIPRPTSPNWEVVVEVIKAAGIWANPDVGNFPDEDSRAAGLRAMYPLSSGSSHCHYNPERYNEANAIRISKEAGYKGLYSIEAGSNNGPDPYTAVQTILDELLRDI